jgi:hypothetical protein
MTDAPERPLRPSAQSADLDLILEHVEAFVELVAIDRTLFDPVPYLGDRVAVEDGEIADLFALRTQQGSGQPDVLAIGPDLFVELVAVLDQLLFGAGFQNGGYCKLHGTLSWLGAPP